MKSKIKNSLIFILIVFFIFFVATRTMVTYSEDTVWVNNNFCKLKYGTDERGFEKFFGKYCAEVDYENHEIIKYYYTTDEMMDYCGRIGFWEFNKWKNKCSN